MGVEEDAETRGDLRKLLAIEGFCGPIELA
jgi:hypothetical protein